MDYKKVLEDVLGKNKIAWCKNCDSYSSHKRGFVKWSDNRTIHLDSKIATRKTLHRALHEVGHCIQGNYGRRFEEEFFAEGYATYKMREYGIVVPREVVARGNDYVARKKRHGDNIIKGKD
jgi:hypothetical protein